MIDENISVDDFVTKANNLVTTSNIDPKEAECQPGASSSFQSTVESPRTTVTTKRNLQIPTSSPSKRIEQMNDGIKRYRGTRKVSAILHIHVELFYILYLYCNCLMKHFGIS